MQHHNCDNVGHPHTDVMKVLLRSGADPNHIPTATGGWQGNRPADSFQEPLSHLVVNLNLDPGPKLELLRELKRSHADFKLKDYLGRRVLDVYFEHLYSCSLTEHLQYRDLRSRDGYDIDVTYSYWSAPLEPWARLPKDGVKFLFENGAVISKVM